VVENVLDRAIVREPFKKLSDGALRFHMPKYSTADAPRSRRPTDRRSAASHSASAARRSA
jgi:hypothetical protein